MRIAMVVAAVLAALFGFGLLVSPADFYAPFKLTLTPMAATVAQAHGATLIGVAAINWLARNFKSPELAAVAAGNLVIQIASLGVAARTYALGAGSEIAPAFVIHIALSILFIWVIVTARGHERGAALDEKPA
jgi:hypothetical protein